MAADCLRDPLIKFEEICIEGGIAKEEDFELIRNETKERVDSDAEWAETQSDPSPSDKMKNVFVQSNNTVNLNLI